MKNRKKVTFYEKENNKFIDDEDSELNDGYEDSELNNDLNFQESDIDKLEKKIITLLNSSKKDKNEILNLIKKYELKMYESENYDQMKIKNWKKQIYEKEDERGENLETLDFIAKQIQKLESNIRILDKSTIKLRSLNLSSKEMDLKIKENEKIIKKSKDDENKEIRNIYLSLLIFFTICLLILIDKTGIFKIFFRI